jgi:hypothetical protein
MTALYYLLGTHLPTYLIVTLHYQLIKPPQTPLCLSGKSFSLAMILGGALTVVMYF